MTKKKLKRKKHEQTHFTNTEHRKLKNQKAVFIPER